MKIFKARKKEQATASLPLIPLRGGQEGFIKNHLNRHREPDIIRRGDPQKN